MLYEREFIALANAGSFNKAAEELFTVESSLSRHIRALEEELGVQLVTRSRQGITLTHMGKIYQEYALRRVRIEDELIASIRAETRQESNALCILVPAVMAKYHLQKALDEISGRYPSLRFDIRAERSGDILPSLENGKCDLCVIRESMDVSDARFSRLLFRKERLFVILPKQDAGRFAGFVPLQELENRPLLIPEEKNASCASFLSACRAEKCLPRNCEHIYPTQSIIDRAALRMGWGIVPEAWTESLEEFGLCALPLQPEVYNRLNFVYLPSSAAKLRTFLRAIRKLSP